MPQPAISFPLTKNLRVCFAILVRRLHFLPILALSLQLQVSEAGALQFYVDGDSTKGDDRRSVKAGQNPDTPFRSIAQAFAVAHQITEGRPHIIEIAAGTYQHGTNGERFPLVVSEPDIFFQTDGGSVRFEGGSAHKFFELSNLGDEFLIQGIDFRNGFGDRGVIASCEACSLRVTDNRFFFNTATESGHIVHVEDGRLIFVNNVVSENGTTPGDAVPALTVHNEFSDTSDPSQRDVIRNNTFHDNDGPTILSSGNGVDLNSNIFVEGVEPVVIDQSTTVDPLFRYNIFWDSDIILVDDDADSIKVLRTIVDTLEQEAAPAAVFLVPDVVLDSPDTLLLIGETHDFFIDVGALREFYEFEALEIPAGVDEDTVNVAGRVKWTPAIADTGRYQIQVNVKDFSKIDHLLSYPLRVAETEPDTTPKPPVLQFSFMPDTTGAIDDLNALDPLFSTAASAGSNQYADPELVNPTSPFRNFIMHGSSPGIDGGYPVVTLDDINNTPNDVGSGGGPANTGNQASGVYDELEITSLPDTVAKGGQTYVFDVTTSPTTTVQRVDVLQGPATMASVFNGERPPIEWVPTVADTGSFLVGIFVTGTNVEGRHYFNLRVKPENEAPLISSTPVTSTLEDEAYSYPVLATDADGDTFTFSLISGPAGVVVDVGGVVSWTPAQDDVGEATVEVQVLDARGASTIHSYALTVLNVNDSPSITSTPLLTATEDEAYGYQIAVTDPDPADSTIYSLLTAPQGMAVDAQGSLTWTPQQGDVGSSSIQLQVSDLAGATALQSFEIEVIEVDDAPAISSDPVTVALEDAIYSYDLVAADEEGGSLGYSVVGPQGLTIDADGRIEWMPTVADTGSHTVTITVTDSAGASADQTYELAVQAVNDAPFIAEQSPADSLVIAAAGTSQPLSVTAIDEEEDPLTYAWFVNGSEQAGETAASLSRTVAAGIVDTVQVHVIDGIDTSSVVWFVDGRLIPRIVVNVETVDFGSVALAEEGLVALSIDNVGQQDLEISDLQLPDLQFSAVFGTATLAAGSTTTLELRFAPTGRGLRETTLSFATNDPDRSSVSIPMTAIASVPTSLTLDLDPGAGDQASVGQTAAAGQQIELSVYAAEAILLIEYGFTLEFDPAQISFDEFRLSSADENLLEVGGSTAVPTVTTPTASTVEIRVASQAGAPGVDGAGLMGTFSFTVDEDFVTGDVAQLRLLSVSLLSADQGADDVLDEELSVELVAPVLRGDFDGDNVVGLTDFFKFADNYLTTNPLYDLDGSGFVDLDDFFEFANLFGTTLNKRLLPLPASVPEGRLFELTAETDMADQVVLRISAVSGAVALDGFAVVMEFDPDVLVFRDFLPHPSSEPLVWLPLEEESGRAALAVSIVGGSGGVAPDDRRNMGRAVFERLSSQSTAIRLETGLGHIDGITERALLPMAIEIESLPTQYALYPAYPNPFNPETTISFFSAATDPRLAARLRPARSTC